MARKTAEAIGVPAWMHDSAELLESTDGDECYLDYSRKVLGQETKYLRTRKTAKKRK